MNLEVSNISKQLDITKQRTVRVWTFMSGEEKMEDKHDWRLTNQENYLFGVTLFHRKYRQYGPNQNWDHDHCEFCWATFSLHDNPEFLKEGYATEDEYRWICTRCYQDFRQRFRWSVVESMEEPG